MIDKPTATAANNTIPNSDNTNTNTVLARITGNNLCWPTRFRAVLRTAAEVLLPRWDATAADDVATLFTAAALLPTASPELRFTTTTFLVLAVAIALAVYACFVIRRSAAGRPKSMMDPTSGDEASDPSGGTTRNLGNAARCVLGATAGVAVAVALSAIGISVGGSLLAAASLALSGSGSGHCSRNDGDASRLASWVAWVSLFASISLSLPSVARPACRALGVAGLTVYVATPPLSLLLLTTSTTTMRPQTHPLPHPFGPSPPTWPASAPLVELCATVVAAVGLVPSVLASAATALRGASSAVIAGPPTGSPHWPVALSAFTAAVVHTAVICAPETRARLVLAAGTLAFVLLVVAGAIDTRLRRRVMSVPARYNIPGARASLV